MRSYMLADEAKVSADKKELKISGYIRGNLLNVNRLLQLTGSKSVFKIKKIELAKDTCP